MGRGLFKAIAWELGAVALICAFGWAAHGGCLRAVFFLDDWTKIVERPQFADLHSGMEWRALTELSFRLTGTSGYHCHLGNLLLHLLGAAAVWWLGPLFFRHAPGSGGGAGVDLKLASFLGALLFAVHPLASEATHYARARDHEMVGFFSFLTAAATLLWIKRGWRWLPALLLAAGLDVLAKGPGPAHAALAVGAVFLFYATPEERRRCVLNRRTLYGFLFLLLIVVAAIPEAVLHWTMQVTQHWGGAFFFKCGLTQDRVFWEYVRRMLWPTGLCPDHLVAMTKSWGDPAAWLATAGVAAWGGLIVGLWRRGHRLAAFLLFVIAANLLLRWFYAMTEFLVEYRAYPSLPWLGLLGGFGLARLWKKKGGPRRTAAAFFLVAALAAGIVLTRGRSEVWSSSEGLTDSILRQYPWQLRAFMERTYADALRNDPDAALARLPDFYARLRDVLAFNRASDDRYYTNWPLWAVCVECNTVDALIRAGRIDAAKTMLDRTRKNMEENHFDDGLLWAVWTIQQARIENRTGRCALALARLRTIDPVDPVEYPQELALALEGVKAQPPHRRPVGKKAASPVRP